MTAGALRKRAVSIHRTLIEEYGERHFKRRLDPLSELVYTVISQNTSDRNCDQAYARLQERFPSWQRARDAPVEEIVEALKPAGLSNIKGPRIKRILEDVTERRGDLDLNFLAQMDVDGAKGWLGSLKGVGPKTAACVLLFALGKPAFPVDTHIHRVTRRLGLISPEASAEEAHKILERAIPPEAYYSFHLNLIAHGRKICQARQPKCAVCVLAPYCDYFKLSLSGSRGAF